MHGTRRIRKKRLSQSGWRIVEEGRTEGGYRLVLENPRGERVGFEASSRPRAHAQAQRRLLPKSASP